MQVAKKKTGREVWQSLKARFVGAERVRDARLQTLKAEFDALRMKEEETVDEFSGRLTAMSVRFSNLGGTLEESVMVKKLLDTVPERFIQIMAGIEQFCDLKTLAFERPLAGSEHLKSIPGGELVVRDLRILRHSSLKPSRRRDRRRRQARALAMEDRRVEAVGAEAMAVEVARVGVVGVVRRKAQRNVTRVTSSASNATPMGIMLIGVRGRRRSRRRITQGQRSSHQCCMLNSSCWIRYSANH
jgi:hypothetical protein